MNFSIDLKILALLFVANGAPVIAKDIFGSRLEIPLDGGLRFFDGHPVLGRSKTVRGISVSLLATTIVAPLLGLEWTIGLWVAAAAMIGDLLSSFLKRRLNRPTSSRAVGIDQLPESVLPLLVGMRLLPLALVDIVAVALAFLAAEILFSKLAYRLHIRDRPY